MMTITHWAFPIVGKDNQGESKPFSTNKWYKALAQAKSGFFPIGLNQLWHGGIHIDVAVLAELGLKSTYDQAYPVRCMADGEIVAYRIDANYPHLEYQKKAAFYSSSFVLVRHLFQMDYVPIPLADRVYRVIGNNDLMPTGVNVRIKPNGTKIGYLSNNTAVTLDLNQEVSTKGKNSTNYWYPIVAITNGYSSVPRLEPQTLLTLEGAELGERKYLGWVSLGQTKLTSAVQTITRQKDTLKKDSVIGKGLTIYTSSNTHSEAIALLPVACEFIISEVSANGEWGKVAALKENSYASSPTVVGWVKMSGVTWQNKPTAADRKPKKIAIYSLYMHLADLAYYKRNASELKQKFITPVKVSLKSANTKKIVGLRVRDKPKEGKILAVLERNVHVKIKKVSKDSAWVCVEALKSGYASIPTLSKFTYEYQDKNNKTQNIEIQGWVYGAKNHLVAVDEKNGIYKIAITEKTKDSDELSKGIALKDASGTVLLSVSPECELNVGEVTEKGVLVTGIISGKGIQTQPLPSTPCYVALDDVNLYFDEEKIANKVNVLEQPYPIKAGEIIGHMGHLTKR